MGYRSFGEMYLSKEALFILPEENKQDLKENWNKINDNYYSFNDWKWYPSYENVALWENFFDELDDEDNTEWYDFIRIGENDNDIEIRTYVAFYLKRSVGHL